MTILLVLVLAALIGIYMRQRYWLRRHFNETQWRLNMAMYTMGGILGKLEVDGLGDSEYAKRIKDFHKKVSEEIK